MDLKETTALLFFSGLCNFDLKVTGVFVLTAS